MPLRRGAGTRAGWLAAACAGALALLGATAAPAAAPPKPTIVSVADFYFGPDSVRIQKGEAVKWVWSSANTYPHDVHLTQGPRGLANKGSYSTRTSAVVDAHFKDTFTTPGTYRFICTIHPTQMKLKVVVKG